MEKQPEIYSIEKAKTPDDHTERKLEPIGLSEKRNHEALVEAREAIVGNQNLYQIMLNAILSKESRNVAGFASIENMFVSYSENLTDSDIENIIRQFNRGFKDYIIDQKDKLKISELTYQDIIRGERDISPRGIQSVLNFIRTRRSVLESKRIKNYFFYTDDSLDARYKIDIVECIFKETPQGLEIAVMNLVQVKSSEPQKEEQESIIRAHERWVHSCLMDLETFNREFSDGVPVGTSIEALTTGEEVEGIIEKMFTNPEGFEPEKLLEHLSFQNLKDRQKAWLFSRFNKILKVKILEIFKNNGKDKEEIDEAFKKLDSLEDHLLEKSRIPKNLATINSIFSTTTVGDKIIKQKKLVDKIDDPKSKKIMGIV